MNKPAFKALKCVRSLRIRSIKKANALLMELCALKRKKYAKNGPLSVSERRSKPALITKPRTSSQIVKMKFLRVKWIILETGIALRNVREDRLIMNSTALLMKN